MRFLVALLLLVLSSCTAFPHRRVEAPSVPAKTVVFVVPLGDVPDSVLANLAQYTGEHFGVEARIAPRVDYNVKFLTDFDRQQIAANNFMDILEGRYKKRIAGSPWIVIGVTAQDMYVPDLDLKYVFAMRELPSFAVVSTARMGYSAAGAPVPDRVAAERVRKVFAKNLAILGFGKTESDDPQSALYRQIRTVDDLDRITKDF